MYHHYAVQRLSVQSAPLIAERKRHVITFPTVPPSVVGLIQPTSQKYRAIGVDFTANYPVSSVFVPDKEYGSYVQHFMSWVISCFRSHVSFVRFIMIEKQRREDTCYRWIIFTLEQKNWFLYYTFIYFIYIYIYIYIYINKIYIRNIVAQNYLSINIYIFIKNCKVKQNISRAYFSIKITNSEKL